MCVMVLIKIITLARGTYSWTLFLSLGQQTTRFRAARVRIWDDLAKMHGTTTDWRHQGCRSPPSFPIFGTKSSCLQDLLSSLFFHLFLLTLGNSCLDRRLNCCLPYIGLFSLLLKWQMYQRLVHSFRLHSLHVGLYTNILMCAHQFVLFMCNTKLATKAPVRNVLSKVLSQQASLVKKRVVLLVSKPLQSRFLAQD